MVGDDVIARTSAREDYLIVSAAGFLSTPVADGFCQAVLKALADAPDAVICDLSKITGLTSLGAKSFLALADSCAVWPETPVALAGATGQLLARLRATRVTERFPMRTNLEDGMRIPIPSPDVVLNRLRLSPTAHAPRLARRFAVQHSPPGADQALRDSVMVVTDELVANAVQYSGSEIELRTSRQGTMFRVSVRDRSPAWPQRRPASSWAENGRGLALVEALSHRWGVLPTAEGGKVVWAQFMTARSAAAPRG